MLYILLLLFFVLGSICLSIALKKRIEMTIPLYLLSFILILYLLSLLQLLSLTTYVFFLLTILSIIYIVYAIVINRDINCKSIFTPGLAIFILSFCASFYFHQERLFSAWDEFSHWGLAVKNMYLLDSLYNVPEAVIFVPTYPPGTPLLQYFFLKILGAYKESTVYIAINVLYFSLTIYLFKNINWENIKKSL